MLSSGQVFLLENFATNSVGALALGERLCMSMGGGVPIHEQTLRCYCRAKKERGVWVKDSLLLEAVESFSASRVQYQSKPVAGFAAQISSEVAYSQASDSSLTPLVSVGDVAAHRKPDSKNPNPMRGFLRRGFLNPSPKEKRESHSPLPLAVKDDEVVGGRSSVLDESFRFWWDQEDDDCDGELSPYPLDWVLDWDEEEDP